MKEKEYIQLLQNEIALLANENKKLKERLDKKEIKFNTPCNYNKQGIKNKRIKIDVYSYNIRELKALEYIVKEISQNGFSPSFRDIKKHVGYNSTSSVKYAIDKMCNDKILRRNERIKGRNLEIVNYDAIEKIFSDMVER